MFVMRLSGLPGLVVDAVVFAVGPGAAGGASNTAWQPLLSCEYFRVMQAVMRSTSGMYSPQRRIASPEHICCCFGV
jgi:hypothetical protein